MSIAWTDVQAIAPELTNTAVPTGTQAVLLALVDEQIDDEAWDTLADYGRRYLAAHLGTLYSSGGAAGGPILSETVGPLARTYGTVASTSGALGSTKYGLEYMRMMKLLGCALGFVP